MKVMCVSLLFTVQEERFRLTIKDKSSCKRFVYDRRKADPTRQKKISPRGEWGGGGRRGRRVLISKGTQESRIIQISYHPNYARITFFSAGTVHVETGTARNTSEGCHMDRMGGDRQLRASDRSDHVLESMYENHVTWSLFRLILRVKKQSY